VIAGGAGDDTIETGDGADVVAPDGPGRTTSGWQREPSDAVSQPGDDTVSTGAGSDMVWVRRGGDVVRGGAQDDRLSASSPEPGTRLLGGGGNDLLYGSPGARMEGQAGKDRIDIQVDATGRRSWWSGGGGRDALNLSIARGVDLDVLDVDAPRRRVEGDGARLATYVSVERVFIGSRLVRATFRGGPAGETFYANARRVRAAGGGGADRLNGSRGPDVLDGGAGRDTLAGAGGKDRCLRGERLTSCERRR
jgi:Ca2+-binding RTX toxin-like protein